MNQRSLFFAICLIMILGIAACTAVPQPTPSPEAAAELVTVPPKRPSATPTTTPTQIPTVTKQVESVTPPSIQPTTNPTSTPHLVISPSNAGRNSSTDTENKPTATNSPEPTQTPFAWNTGIKEIIRAEKVIDFVWSPTHNEFVFYRGCGENENEVYLTNLLQQKMVDVTPPDLSPCYATLLWHPSGKYFLLSSESQENWSEVVGWQVDRSSLNVNKFDWADYYWGWLNDNLQITQRWTESDTYSISIFNVVTKESVSHVFFAGKVMDVSKSHVILNESFGGTYGSSAAIFAQYEISPDMPLRLGDRNVKLLGRTQEIEGVRWGYLFFSKAIDVLPSSDKILVLTWGKEIPEPFLPQEVLVGTFPVNLQLWDADIDELVLVKEGGIYGRFSPSGNELVTLTASPDSPQLELTNQLTNETIITQPAYAESAEYTVDVYAFTSFSPNGRFLTYYSPEQELVIYDIAFGTFLPSVTAVPITPVWSPDNSRFIYQDSELGLSVYEIEPHTTYSLTQGGCDTLRNPQWSFDGSYLSVSVPCAGTAVLQLP